MAKLTQSIRSLFAPIQPIAPGMYHYIAPQDDPRNYRLHLRVEGDGNGILIVNASTVLHLNQTAAEYAYYFVHNTPAEQVAKKMAGRYRVEPEQAFADYRNLGERILTLVETPDLDPVTFLDFNRRTPYSGKLTAPYRLDCALTYRLPPGADPEFAPTKRVARELNTAEWAQVLEKAWNNGIPHVVFTGGEPTLRDDLPTLAEHAEYLGMVAGLLSDGLRLRDKSYRDKILATGLDHLLITLQADNDAAWEAIRGCLEGDIFTAVHLTLSEANAESYAQFLSRLAEMGVPAISLTASSNTLNADLQAARDLAASLNMELIWDLPVPYSAYNPVNLEVPDAELVAGAGRAWLYVEPDGDVLPAQGAETVLGNLLNDPWEKIWK
jgi:organic radical activating enzyme